MNELMIFEGNNVEVFDNIIIKEGGSDDE